MEIISQLIFPIIVFFVTSLIFIAYLIIERRIAKHSPLEIFIRHLYSPLQILLTLAFLYLIFSAFTYGVVSNPVINTIFKIIMILGFGYLATKCLDLSTSMVLQYYGIQLKDNHRARAVHTCLGVIKKLSKVVIIGVTLTFILTTIETIRIQWMSLLASAGVLSIILGFAAQKTISNFFAGLQIAIAQPIRVEDVVVIENEWGTIEEIHLTFVVVKLWDLRRMIVPISYFTDHIFQNWTQKTADILATVFLYVDHKMQIQPIREEVDRILEGNKLWDGKVKVVQVVEILEHALQVRILASAPNSGTAFDLRCAIRESLMAFMQKNYSEFLPRLRTELTREPSKPVESTEPPPKEPVRSPAPTLSANPNQMNP